MSAVPRPRHGCAGSCCWASASAVVCLERPKPGVRLRARAALRTEPVNSEPKRPAGNRACAFFLAHARLAWIALVKTLLMCSRNEAMKFRARSTRPPNRHVSAHGTTSLRSIRLATPPGTLAGGRRAHQPRKDSPAHVSAISPNHSENRSPQRNCNERRFGARTWRQRQRGGARACREEPLCRHP